MSGGDLCRICGEALFVDERAELAGVSECCCFAKDFSVMCLAETGEQRHECKYA